MTDLSQDYFKGWKGKVLRCVCNQDNSYPYTLGDEYLVEELSPCGSFVIQNDKLVWELVGLDNGGLKFEMVE